MVADWALTDMHRSRKKLGLPKDRTRWPAPDVLPTLWCRTAFKAAHVYVINRDGSSIDGNDFFDWCHYTAAAHADVFVTRDRRLRAVARECPAPKPRVMSFEDWARGMLGGAAPEARAELGTTES